MMGDWLLPEGIADTLPAEARRIEELRRKLLDLYRVYGYELVAPPLVEYIDSLLSGTGRDLSLRTFKLVDQLSGRTLGIRADMTRQVTRIDAHLLNRDAVTRLCYCGSVLHTRPAGLLARRELLQIGAELYGHAGVEADLEIVRLAFASVRVAGVVDARLDLYHPGLAQSILDADAAIAPHAEAVFTLLRDKDIPGLRELAAVVPGVAASTWTALERLPNLYGGLEVLDQARQCLPALPGVTAALDQLQTTAQALDVPCISIDLAEVGGYGYHSGVTFAIYAQGWHDEIVRGGRYDKVGESGLRARPATGFSLDLRKLAAGLQPAQASPAIRAPWSTDPVLEKVVHELRSRGEVVVQMLPGHEHEQDEFFCDRELYEHEGAWKLRSLERA